MNNIVLVLFAFLSVTNSLAHAGGETSGGGVGFPVLPADVKFSYKCKLALQETNPQKSLHFEMPVTYSNETNSGTGVLEISTKANSWIATESGTSPKFPIGQHLFIRPGMFIQLDLVGDSETVVTALVNSRSNDVLETLKSDKYLAQASMKKIVNGETQSVDLSFSCRKN